MSAVKTRKALAVWFKALDLWSVNSFFSSRWQWPLEHIKPLGEALERRVESVDLVDKAAGLMPLVTLRFDGSMELRNARAEDIKGALFCAYADDLVFSRIDVRNGAIGIVPTELPRVAVSNEFPVYRVSPHVASTEYLHLLVRSPLFRGILNSLISGASGRKRIQAIQFEAIPVPLPPLETQRAIVDYWHAAQRAQREAEARIAAHEAAIDAQFLGDLGIIRRVKVRRPKFFAIWWNELEKWSFDNAVDKSFGLHDLALTSYPTVELGSVATVSYGIQKSPANRPGQHPRPYLRVANVRRGYLDLSEIKYINVPDSEMESYRLKPGDILFVEGNGSRAELGRVAKWDGEIENCVHQNHLIKVRLDQNKLSSEYAMCWFNSEEGRKHFFRSMKTSSGLGTINSNEVRSAPIPLPPLEVQQAIMEKVFAGRAAIAQEREAMQHDMAWAKSAVEAMILGAQPVPEQATVLENAAGVA